jgi:Sec-independent protein secretion pathway component TatC
MLAIPLMLLFESTLLFMAFTEKREAKAAAAASQTDETADEAADDTPRIEQQG